MMDRNPFQGDRLAEAYESMNEPIWNQEVGGLTEDKSIVWTNYGKLSKQVWLIEYSGAVPSPVYVARDYEATHGNHTLDVWSAKAFNTREEAEAWMVKPTYLTSRFQTIYCIPFGKPWRAVAHVFSGE